MGPNWHTPPAYTPPAGLRVAEVSSADILATRGHPLAARVWVEALPGETFDQAARRLAIADLERRARGHEVAAAKLRAAIAALEGEAGG